MQRQRGGGGPCAQSGQRGRQDVFKEVFHTPGAGGDKGVKTEENEKVKYGGRVINQQSPPIALEKVGPVDARQVGKVGHQSDGGQLH